MPDQTKLTQIAELKAKIAALEAGGADAPLTAAEIGAMSAADIAGRSEEIQRRGVAGGEPSPASPSADGSAPVDPLEPTGVDRIARAFAQRDAAS